MGFPAVGLEHMFRNPRAEVARFLRERHAAGHKVFNFCAEPGRCDYSQECFHEGAVYPFFDHGVPHPRLIFEFCEAAAAWLAASPAAVAVLHCKAGKGRAGMMACCLLLHTRAYETAEEAIAFYNTRRVTDMKGLTVPTQLYYVRYYERFLRAVRSPPAPPGPAALAAGLSERTPYRVLRLLRVVVTPRADSDPLIKLAVLEGGAYSVHASRWDRSVFDVGVELLPALDYSVVFWTRGSLFGKKKLCTLWFNTAFVDDSLELTFVKTELHGVGKNKDRYHKKLDKGASISLKFEAAFESLEGLRARVASRRRPPPLASS
jgi:phosphatidylinositol-3,4,5-trisphosphate 3-phosphatase/dual-specificity protein phosphatase PTEN